MDILNQIVEMMTKEEVRHFKLFAARTQVKGARKDIELFDYIRRMGEEFDEDKIFEKLYGEGDKNPFYRLKNRLLGDLNKSIILQHIDDDDILYIFHLISLARFFQNRSNTSVALHYIRRAEKKAIQMENFELLDFIYSELIKLSHEIPEINPEDYIHKRKENREQLNHYREIDDILAAVIYRLKISQDSVGGRTSIADLLQKTVEDFSQNPSLKQSAKLRYTLYNAVSRMLLSRGDYFTLEEYLLSTYDEFQAEGLFSRRTHETKLQMLVYLVNTLAKNGKLKEAEQFIDQLKDGLEEYGRIHYKKYLFYYYNGLVAIYKQLNISRCIEILEECVQEEKFKDQPGFDFLMWVNLAVLYFDDHKFRKALKTLVKVGIHDAYSQQGSAFRLRLAVFEIVLRMETAEFDVIDSRLEKVRKEYADLLETDEFRTEKMLLSIIRHMNESVNYKADEKLAIEVKGFMETTPRGEEMEDFSFMDYHFWLSGKFGKVVAL